MNRTLTWLNLAGVAALAVLCVCQWRANRALNLDINALEKTGLTQTARLAEQDKTLAGLAADLENFRTQITRANAELRETTDKLQLSENAIGRLRAERDQLKDSIASWTEAVKVRDERIDEANHRLREVGGRLRDAVEKFNELAARYNERSQQLNDLTTRYNDLVQQLEPARSGETQPAGAKDKAS